jgi:hypothetical protein
MVGDVNYSLCKINDEISDRKDVTLEDTYFLNGFTKNSLHNVLLKFRIIKDAIIPSPQDFVTILYLIRFLTSLCKLRL